MKKVLISLAVVVALVALFVGFRVQQDTTTSATPDSVVKPEASQQCSMVPDQDGKIRMIYTIVDQDGVYFGDQRVDLEIAIGFLDEIAKREKTHNVYVHITDLARYGDAVRFYTGIDRSRFHVTSFPTRPVPIRYRLPLIGIFRKLGCCWVDEMNNQEIW